MDCCASVAKYILFILNFLFWGAGIAFLGVGIWLQVDPSVSNIVEVAGVSIYIGAIAFICVGTLMLVIGFCGCCGAIKENRCLLGIYFTFVLLIFLVQIAVSIWAFVSHSSLESLIKTGLNESLPINATDKNQFDAVISLQATFSCCGLVNGCEDWANNAARNCTCDPKTTGNDTVCKIYPDSTCTNFDNPGKPMYTTGCYDSILQFFEDNIIVIAGVALGIALSEIFVMIFALMVCQAAKSKYETV